MRARSTFGCCITDDSYSKKELNIPQKFFFALKKFFLVCLDLLAIYVVIVTCGATVQRKITLEKLWYPEAKNYGANRKCLDMLMQRLIFIIRTEKINRLCLTAQGLQ